MLFEDMRDYFRAILDDYGEIDEETGLFMSDTQEYSDSKLSVLLVVSIRYLQTRLRIPSSNRIEVFVEPNPFYVNPFVDICDDFAELVILRSLCALQTRNIDGQFGMENVSTTLGPANIKTGTATWKGMPEYIWKHTSPCAELNAKLLEIKTFDTRKLQAVYAMLPNVSGQGNQIANNRMQAGGRHASENMIQ